MSKEPEAHISYSVPDYFGNHSSFKTKTETIRDWVGTNLRDTKGIEYKQAKLVDIVTLLTQELLNKRPDLFDSVSYILDGDERDSKLVFPDD